MTFQRSFFSLRSNVLAALVVALASCHDGNGGGGGGGSSDSDARVDIGVTDAPVDQLAAFRTRLDELVLLREDGTETGDLLGNSLEVEFLGLDGTFAWVASAKVAAGTYSGARVRFVPDSIVAVAKDGESIQVQESADFLDVSFATPLVLSELDYRSISIDLDLSESLANETELPTPPLVLTTGTAAPLDGGVSLPPLVFTPQGSIASDDGSAPQALDEVEARFLRFGTTANTLIVHAFGGDEGELELGEVSVAIAAPALLLSQEGVLLTESEFFAALLPDQTLLEVHGSLTGGSIQASMIEIEDLIGDGTGGYPIKIEGLVLAHQLNVGFEILILEIEEGFELVDPELQELGNPSSIGVVYDASTLFLAEEGGGTTGPDALVPGLRVKVKFAQFLSSPFQAGRVDLADLHPHVSSSVVDVVGLPSQIVVHVDPGEAVLGNQVATSETDVLVDLEGASLFLDTLGEPTLVPEQILVGSRLQVVGPFGGSATEPAIDAVQVKARPGRLEGARVSAIDRASLSFIAEGGQIADSFGPGVGAGSLRVTFDPRAFVEGDATSIEDFFTLFESLVAPQMLRVEIEGISTGVPDTILAFEVEAQIEP